jgi:hypothetical protein
MIARSSARSTSKATSFLNTFDARLFHSQKNPLTLGEDFIKNNRTNIKFIDTKIKRAVLILITISHKLIMILFIITL